MNDNKLTGFEQFWYYAACILTFGAPFTLKVIIKKALEIK